MNPIDPTFWRKKLSALMHDSPAKVVRIWDHYQRAAELQLPDSFEDYELFDNKADHLASAADRLPWPNPKVLRSEFDGVDNHFKHPLGGGGFVFDREFQGVGQAEESGQLTRPTLLSDDDPRGEFWARWRFWRWWASHRDPRLAFMPAETRLPDHTIWSHLFVTSAFQACEDAGKIKPAFLLFTLGPAQSFIAESRSTRDLWSGSYLLSYLVGSAAKSIALSVGPDNFLFPNLSGQPLFDLLLKDEIWSQVSTSQAGAAWDCFGYDKTPSGERNEFGLRRLLTPSLPNRFLAVVPESNSSDLARSAVESFESARAKIAESVESFLLERLPEIKSDWNGRRFRAQIDRMLVPHWQVLPWPTNLDDADKWAECLPDSEAAEGFRATVSMASKIPVEHRDNRYYSGGTATGKLNSPAAAHSVLYHATNWLLDAVKGAGAFDAWDDASSWTKGILSNKDYLNGREEILFSPHLYEKLEEKLGHFLFKDTERPGLGASSLVKRLWHLSYLKKEHGFEDSDFSMPSTRGIALSEPFSEDRNDDEKASEQEYYAVLALDGDEMGKWISGAKNPILKDQLSKEAKEYFEKNAPDFLESRRSLSPSFHLQFSESLSNFALYCAGRIVEAHDGRLIYAGGDDVLAMLPATSALACAESLRSAFRGDARKLDSLSGSWERMPNGKVEKIHENRLFESGRDGFLRLHAHATSLEEEPKRYHCMVPGPNSDVSVGIAVGHARDPLQRLVKAAQECERRAKGEMGRSAVFTQVVKRSGEIAEWGCKWDSGGLTLFHHLSELLLAGKIGNRFPYRVLELLTPYLPLDNSESKQVDEQFLEGGEEIVRRDLSLALERHWEGAKSSRLDAVDETLSLFSQYWKSMNDQGADAEACVDSLVNLHRVLAWMTRRKGAAS